jgi:hypothetical protein
MTTPTTPKLPEPATGAMKVVAWLDDGLSASNGTEESSHRVVTEKTRQSMPRSASEAYNDPLVRLSDAQALAGEVERLRALLDDASKLLKRTPPATMWMYVGRDRKSFGVQAKELAAALDASRALATQEAK